jgi:hypothetical protein
MDESVLNYSTNEVVYLLKRSNVNPNLLTAIQKEKIDGKALLILNERDIYRLEQKYHSTIGDVKRLLLVINKVQQQNRQCLIYLGIELDNQNNLVTNLLSHNNSTSNYPLHHQNIFNQEIERISPANSVDGSNSGPQFATCIQPEFFKTTISLGEY